MKDKRIERIARRLDRGACKNAGVKNAVEYKIETDGWDLDRIYPLEEVAWRFGRLSSLVNELQVGRRTMSLVEMRDALLENIEGMRESLLQINDDDMVVEVDEDL